MNICTKCGQLCKPIPVLANDIDDESTELELVSDCCYHDIEVIAEDHYEALLDLKLDEVLEVQDTFTELELLILQDVWDEI